MAERAWVVVPYGLVAAGLIGMGFSLGIAYPAVMPATPAADICQKAAAGTLEARIADTFTAMQKVSPRGGISFWTPERGSSTAHAWMDMPGRKSVTGTGTSLDEAVADLARRWNEIRNLPPFPLQP